MLRLLGQTFFIRFGVAEPSQPLESSVFQVLKSMTGR
jgi:hypothetical protein